MTTKPLQIFPPDLSKPVPLPFFLSVVEAEFPSPADDYLERDLDLNEYCIEHPPATYYVRVSGNSMQKVELYDGDILVADRALDACHGSSVLAVIGGEHTVKRLQKHSGKTLLAPENDAFPVIEIRPEQEFMINGVVAEITAPSGSPVAAPVAEERPKIRPFSAIPAPSVSVESHRCPRCGSEMILRTTKKE